MFVTRNKYEGLLRQYNRTAFEVMSLTEALVDSDSYIEELEKKLTAKKKVAKKATKKVSK